MKRIGKFQVSWPIVESGHFHLILAKMEFIPYKVECLYSNQTFLYEGLSWLFDEKASWTDIPMYKIHVTNLDNHDYYVEAIKI